MPKPINLEAIDTFHATRLGADTFHPGMEFDAPEAIAKELESRNLAKRTAAKKSGKK